MKFVFIFIFAVLIWLAVNGQWLYALITLVVCIALFAIHITTKNNIEEKEFQRKERERDELFKAKREEEDLQARQNLQREIDESDELLKKNGDYTQMGDLFYTKPRLFSEKNQYYDDIRDSLEEKNWNSANRLTLEKIRTLIGHGYISFGNFRLNDDSIPILSRDLKKIPVTDLITMDRLWSQYSNGKFGFWTQYQLYLEANKDFDAFCKKVGWNSDPMETENVPKGHLPNCLFYYRGGILLEKSQQSKELVKKVLRSPVKPESPPVERDENWYEDRYSAQSTSRPEDEWKFDNANGDWYREVYNYEYYGSNISDPSHGFLNLIELMERVDLTLK